MAEEPMGPGEIPAEDQEEAATQAVPAAQAVGDRAKRRNSLALMKEHFAKQKKVAVFIPHEQDEIVRVNGYAFRLKRGTNVEVPEQVAEILHRAWAARARANQRRKIEQINL